MLKVKFSLCLIKHCARKTYAWVEFQLHMYLTLELDGAVSAFHSNHFTPGETLLADILPYAKRLGRLHSQSGHHGEERNPRPCQESNPGHPASSLVTIFDVPGYQLFPNHSNRYLTKFSHYTIPAAKWIPFFVHTGMFFALVIHVS
jgi:hypothetical protein